MRPAITAAHVLGPSTDIDADKLQLTLLGEGVVTDFGYVGAGLLDPPLAPLEGGSGGNTLEDGAEPLAADEAKPHASRPKWPPGLGGPGARTRGAPPRGKRFFSSLFSSFNSFHTKTKTNKKNFSFLFFFGAVVRADIIGAGVRPTHAAGSDDHHCRDLDQDHAPTRSRVPTRIERHLADARRLLLLRSGDVERNPGMDSDADDDYGCEFDHGGEFDHGCDFDCDAEAQDLDGRGAGDPFHDPSDDSHAHQLQGVVADGASTAARDTQEAADARETERRQWGPFGRGGAQSSPLVADFADDVLDDHVLGSALWAAHDAVAAGDDAGKASDDVSRIRGVGEYVAAMSVMKRCRREAERARRELVRREALSTGRRKHKLELCIGQATEAVANIVDYYVSCVEEVADRLGTTSVRTPRGGAELADWRARARTERRADTQRSDSDGEVSEQQCREEMDFITSGAPSPSGQKGGKAVDKVLPLEGTSITPGSFIFLNNTTPDRNQNVASAMLVKVVSEEQTNTVLPKPKTATQAKNAKRQAARKAQKGSGAQCDEVLRGAKVETMATTDGARDIGGDGCATRTGTTQGVAEDGTDAAKAPPNDDAETVTTVPRAAARSNDRPGGDETGRSAGDERLGGAKAGQRAGGEV